MTQGSTLNQRIFNSLSRKAEDFVPQDSKKVKLYVCGPTVYDLLHVGNFRGPIFFNLVRNWLEYLGHKVEFVFNYTDVDDKIINRGKEDGVPSQQIAEKYVEEFRKDYFRLGLRAHDRNPKVTETMPEIIQMVTELIERKVAYVSGGDVLFSIKKFNEYGKLSGRNTEDLMVGVRIDPNDKKEDPLDFALWKGAKEGEPFWESPWGKGRPGWHIECSAMIRKHLGDTIDIHGGGMDLIFPHHENEIAQSEGCTGKLFVKYWMHNNMINFGGAKMSKSLGNIRTARSFMDEFTPEVLKYMLLSTHYRSVTDLSEDSIENSISGLARIYSALALADSVLALEASAVGSAGPIAGSAGPSAGGGKRPEYKSAIAATLNESWSKIEKSLCDDFGTPEVMAAIFDVVRNFNGQVKRGLKGNPKVIEVCKEFKIWVKQAGELMALFQMPAAEFLVTLDDQLLRRKNLNRSEIDLLVQKRMEARTQKNFPESDRLREELTKLGISVSDFAGGSFWEVTK